MSNLAFVNIASWAPEQVANWLRGLDDAIVPYADQFIVDRVTGKRLLCLGYHDLHRLQVHRLGQQELILEAIDLLCSLHNIMETETLQSISLQLGCKARSLHNEVKAIRLEPRTENTGRKLPVNVLSGVADAVASIKNLASWLDRSPFEGGAEYGRVRDKILHLGSDMLAAAQGDNIIASEDDIMNACLKLSDVSDRLVTESRDPIILQPTSIELATIRKKPEEELGMHIQSSHNGTHTIGRIKDESPADRCGKVEEGDEVIQVNYQTVVGWQLKKLVAALKANEKEVTLTLKKRPHHVNPFGVSPKKRKVPKNLKQSTFPKAMSRRKSKEDKKGGSRHLKDCFINSVPPPSEPFSESAQDLENEGDTDNEIDNDVFQSGGTLPVIQLEAKQRRATVSGGSPTITRPAITICDVSPPQRPKSHTISSPSSEGSAASITSPVTDLTFSPHLLSPEPKRDILPPEPVLVPEAPAVSLALSPELQHKVELRIHASPASPTSSSFTSAASSPSPSLGASPKKRKGSEAAAREVAGGRDHASPTLIRLTRIDSTRRGELAEEERRLRAGDVTPTPSVTSTMSGADSDTPRSSTSSSYMVNIVGGVPQKTSTSSEGGRDSPSQSPSVMLRKNFMRRMGANRRISCKDLGHGDCQGWLYKKSESSGLSKKWAKRWFVLKEQNLYYYTHQEDLKAQGVIHLPGFQVSPAPEIKSKKYAFKAHHSGTTFYFASERQDDMGKWMNKMGLAAIVYDTKKVSTTAGFSKPDSETGYYSETDEDEPASPPQPPKPSPTSTPPQRRSRPLAMSSSTPPPSGQGSKEDLTNKESLSNLLRTIQKADLGIDGSDVKNRRQSAMAQSKKLAIRNSAELECGRHLTSLQRTLKAREQELEMIDSLLKSTNLDADTLKSFKAEHPDIAKPKGKPGYRGNGQFPSDDDDSS